MPEIDLDKRQVAFDGLPDQVTLPKRQLLQLFAAAVDSYDIIRRHDPHVVRNVAGAPWITTAEAQTCRDAIEQFDVFLFGSSLFIPVSDDRK